MNWAAFFESTSFMIVLLNPFLLTVYLIDIVRDLDAATYRWVLARGAIVSGIVFSVFAVFGDVIFQDVLHVRFSSFLVFGGIVFVMIGLRFAISGPDAITILRGPPEHLAGSVAMPFMIGPGTVSASVLAGANMHPLAAVFSIAVALFCTVAVLLFLKWLHDVVRRRQEALVERYVEFVGRMSALVIGTIAVDMILRGLGDWLRMLDLVTGQPVMGGAGP